MTISSEQWELILNQYDRLFWKIAHRISGDNAISALEDNYQDICIAALNAVAGFEKKEGRKFDDFWGEIGFDKYIKTVVWNAKNSKGKQITKRYPLTKGVVSVFENEEVLNLEGHKATTVESPAIVRELSKQLDDEQKECVKMLLEDGSLIHPSGKINTSQLSRQLGISWRKAKKLLVSIAEIMNNDL